MAIINTTISNYKFEYRKILQLVFIFSFVQFVNAQDRPTTYYTQWSDGAGVISNEFGRGVPRTGDINADGLADFIMPGSDMFHVGIAKIVDDQLSFEMEQISYYNLEDYLLRAFIFDFDGDGFDDCLIHPYNLVDNCCAPYLFYTENSKVSDEVSDISEPYLQDREMFFGHFNADDRVDGIYVEEGEYKILDGMTGSIHSVPWRGSMQNETIHDFNSDGLIDLQTEITNYGALDTTATVILINQGNFEFAEYASIGRTSADEFGDFDNDGISDIITNIGDQGFLIRTNLMSDNQSIITYVDYPDSGFEKSYIVHDLDGDEYDDIIIFTNGTSYFCHNRKDLTFEIYSVPFRGSTDLFFTWDTSWGTGNLVAEDGSGVPVFYYATFNGSEFKVENYEHFINSPVLTNFGYGYTSAVVDIDQDGDPEILVPKSRMIISKEYEDEVFKNNTVIYNDDGFGSNFSVIMGLGSGDFNQDGILDVVFSESNSPANLNIRYGQADSTFADPTLIGQGFNLISDIITTDVNGDGMDDFGISGGGKFSIFFSQENGQLIEQQILPQSTESWLFFDPNKDGLPDLAFTYGDSTNIYMNIEGNFEFKQSILGTVCKSKQVGNNQLILHYRTDGPKVKFITVDSTGGGHEVINDWGIDLDGYVSHRMAYQLDYNQDGLDDFCFNFGNNAYVVYGLDDIFIESIVIPDRNIAGLIDLNNDKVDDFIWQIGPQIHVEIVESITDAVTNVDSDSEIRIYPNPVNDKFEISVPNSMKIQSIKVFNANGVCVDNNNDLDVSHLPQGIYFVHIEMKTGGFVVKKIVKI